MHAKFHGCGPTPYSAHDIFSLPSYSLKEKFPQAFVQIVWMEDDFRNLTAKVWANLDNPIKRYNFSKVALILCMSPSQMALF